MNRRVGIHLLIAAAMVYGLAQEGYAMTNSPSEPDQRQLAEEQAAGRIILTCPEQVFEPDALCQALEDALLAHAPGLTFERADEAGELTGGDLAVALHITRADTHMLEGYLEWRSATSATEQGPPVTFGVTDAEIAAHMYVPFAAGLVRLSALPLKQ